MPIPKKWISAVSFLCIGLSIWSIDHYFGILIEDLQSLSPPVSNELNLEETTTLFSEISSQTPDWEPTPTTEYKPGPLRPLGEAYTKTIIVPKTKDDDVSWIFSNFGQDPNINAAIYVVDDTTADLHTPRNKGHEVLAYLSFIVEQYHNLSDVNIFLHSHRFAWHNNDFLGNDAVQMISRLSAERVQREGYMNLRCHWEPGCPSWMHPGNKFPHLESPPQFCTAQSPNVSSIPNSNLLPSWTIEADPNKQEEPLLAPIWTQLFPLDRIPPTLAQPCCAQFALSAHRIHALPLARYVFFRDWLLRTPLSDYMSGRVWEYVWQFIFTGRHVLCVDEHVCYCDGFGVCFGGKREYEGFREKERKEGFEKAGVEERKGMEEPEVGMDLQLEAVIQELKDWCEERLEGAKVHGDLATSRAVEAGREWHDGDGF
ncbi:hypothetical protein HYFRA_00005063 [Hymenoscyphus fraxineus]|uniref:Uncharacterized protein n=1 Tax=Hymenoscyphus fraxineus TaxID=746836 RepID=A0A9N9KLE6_9HELO|nr:hypothetical protein HYFRA_00005063 [Hymenoscyphus fraxineus]